MIFLLTFYIKFLRLPQLHSIPELGLKGYDSQTAGQFFLPVFSIDQNENVG
jgi:hypothetical protein